MYDIIKVPVDAVTSARGVELVKPGTRVDEFFVLNVPAGVAFQIAIGSGPFGTITGPFTMEPTDAMAEAGIRYRVEVANAGAPAVEFWCVYSGQLNPVALG